MEIRVAAKMTRDREKYRTTSLSVKPDEREKRHLASN